MKSFNVKVMLAVACAGLAFSLLAGNAFAGDRDRGGWDRDRGGQYDRGGWDRDRDRGRDYDRDDRRSYRPGYVVGNYRPVHRPVYVERSRSYYPSYVYVSPSVEYVYPTYCERVVVVRPAYRSYGWGIGFSFGR